MKKITKTVLASAILAILSTPLAADMALPTEAEPAAATTRDITVQALESSDQQAIANLQAPASDLQVSASLDRGDAAYHIGDQVSLTVKANQDAYLTVLNVGTSGKVTILYPNEYQSNNRVKAGESVTIPGGRDGFAMQLSGPVGTELVKVIATTGTGELIGKGQLQKAGHFQAAKALGGKLAKDIDVVLQQQQQAGNQWAETNLVLNVTNKPGAISGSTPAPGVPQAAIQGGVAQSPVQAASAPLPTTGFDLSLRTDKLVYHKGDHVSIYATAEKDCRLTLVDVGTSGKVHILFPNRYQPDNHIRAGQTVQIPADTAPVAYQVAPPGGVEALMGICRTDDEETYPGQYNFKSHVFQPWGDSAMLAKDLEVTLRQPKAELAHTATTFLIVDK